MKRAYGKGFPSNRTPWNKGKKKNKLNRGGMPLKPWEKKYQDERK